MKRSCLRSGATSQDLGCLVKWRVPQLVDELDFEELALNMKVSTQQQIWTDFCCSKQTDSFLLESFDFSCFWADVPFRGFVLHDAQPRWPMAQVSAAYAASTCLRSSRSLRLSLKSTAQVTWRPVKHRLIESCLVYYTCKQKPRFCWLPSVSHHLETDDLKNIWREI